MNEERKKEMRKWMKKERKKKKYVIRIIDIDYLVSSTAVNESATSPSQTLHGLSVSGEGEERRAECGVPHTHGRVSRCARDASSRRTRKRLPCKRCNHPFVTTQRANELACFGIPEPNGAIFRAGCEHCAVWRPCNHANPIGVSFQHEKRRCCRDVPKTDCSVARTAREKCSGRIELNTKDGIRMAFKSPRLTTHWTYLCVCFIRILFIFLSFVLFFFFLFGYNIDDFISLLALYFLLKILLLWIYAFINVIFDLKIYTEVIFKKKR